jgi:hypothetical protein
MATKRSKTKYPGLKKELYSKIKQQYFDIDYINSLSEDEKQWLNDFMNEFLGANLKESERLMHNNKTLSKSVYDANNSRNRDIYNVARTGGRLDSLDEALLNQLEESELDESFEDRLISKIDEE